MNYVFRLMITVLALNQASVFAEVAATRMQLDGFLAGYTGAVMVYTDRENHCFFIDLFAEIPGENLLCTGQVESPLVSPDGNLVTFWRGGIVLVCSLKVNAVPVEVASGCNPHWWIDGDTGGFYIIYCSEDGQFFWPQPGKTLKQRIDPGTFQRIGEPVELLDKSFNGGLSKNGRYMCTAYESIDIYDIESDSHYPIPGAGCNASISPSADPDHQGEMLHLNRACVLDGVIYRSHETYGIVDKSGRNVWYVVVPPGVAEWLYPEWSTHQNLSSVVGAKGVAKDLYIVNHPLEDVLMVLKGDYKLSHLWISEDSGSSAGFPAGGDVADKQMFGISPNPSAGVFMLSGFTGSSINVMTANGMLVGSVPVVNGTANWKAALPGLTGGVYVISSTDGAVQARVMLVR